MACGFQLVILNSIGLQVGSKLRNMAMGILITPSFLKPIVTWWVKHLGACLSAREGTDLTSVLFFLNKSVVNLLDVIFKS